MENTEGIKIKNILMSRTTAYLAIAAGFVCTLILSAALFGSDFKEFFGWWFLMFTTGIIFLPTGLIFFKNFADCGIIFSSVIGVAVMGWLSWFLASTHILPFTWPGSCIILLLCAAANVVLIFVSRKKGTLCANRDIIMSKLPRILFSALLFLVIFMVWTYLRGYKPGAYGTTESIMDFGFMNAIDRTSYAPIEDLWMSGNNLNYYYVGLYISTFLSKLSGVGVAYGYNLMLTSLATFAFMLPYSLIVTVFSHLVTSKNPKRGRSLCADATGILSGMIVSICGNFHYVIFSLIVPPVRDILGLTTLNGEETLGLHNYFFPESTRYIGYMPQTHDKTIHEFPAYSFILGDLHAHVINIMFVLLVLGILYSYIVRKRKEISQVRMNEICTSYAKDKDGMFGFKNFFSKVFDPTVIGVGFLIGLFHMTNFWDYPIYFVVSGAVILFVNLLVCDFKPRALLLTFFHAIVVVIISKIVCLPFTLSFDSISNEIGFTDNSTPIYQLLILWGIPLLCIILYFIVLICENKMGVRLTRKGEIGPKSRVLAFLKTCEPTDIFILIVMLCGAGLVLLPELIYVKDIYSSDYQRANTMFKLTYQAFILFGVGMGYIIARLLVFTSVKNYKKTAAVLMLIVFICAGYTVDAVKVWNIGTDKEFIGIDSSLSLKDINEYDYEAVKWMNENIDGRPVILECCGDSYSHSGRISAWTGLPTVLGWTTHEWLWRSSGNEGKPQEITKRENDITRIYTSADPEEVQQLLTKYDIRYICIGNLENERFGESIKTDYLTSLGEVVYKNDGFTLVDIKK